VNCRRRSWRSYSAGWTPGYTNRNWTDESGRRVITLPLWSATFGVGARWPLLPKHLNYITRASLFICAARTGPSLVDFGRRRISFSMRFIAHRVAQHDVPGSAILSHMASGPLGSLLIPVSIGRELRSVAEERSWRIGVPKRYRLPPEIRVASC
jgi:hypothetical protein